MKSLENIQRKIFIDCGTNMGMGFDQLAKSLSLNKEDGWEIYGFEPNKYAYQEYLNNIKSKRYSTLNNNNIVLYNKAVWDKEEKIMFCHEAVTEFYGQERIDDLNEKYAKGEALDFIKYDLPATGGSCVKEIKEELDRPKEHDKMLTFLETSEVQAIDFSSWVVENFSKNDYIILKMDIEGSEYKVLPHMIENGSLSYVNKIYIEFHDWVLPTRRNQTDNLKKLIPAHGVELMLWG